MGLAHWACGQRVPVPAGGLEFPGLWISCCAPERNGQSGGGKRLGWRRGLPVVGSLRGAPQGWRGLSKGHLELGGLVCVGASAHWVSPCLCSPR